MPKTRTDPVTGNVYAVNDYGTPQPRPTAKKRAAPAATPQATVASVARSAPSGQGRKKSIYARAATKRRP